VSAMQRNRIFMVVSTPTQYTIYEDTDTVPNGNEILDPALDRRVSQTSINPRYALTIDAGAGRINFDSRGFTSSGAGLTAFVVPVNLRVTAPFGASLDCIEVSATRVRMGVWNAGTATCIAQ